LRHPRENQNRLLDTFRQAAGKPLRVEDLDAAGVSNPAMTVYELQLNGHTIERAYRDDRFAGFYMSEQARRQLEADASQGVAPPRRSGWSQLLARLNAGRAPGL
jgi:hypothetical protein